VCDDDNGACGPYLQVIIQKVMGQPFSIGYNAMADCVEDLLASGVIDPAKVCACRLVQRTS